MKRLGLFFLIGTICLLMVGIGSSPAEEESWPGVDVAVVEKYAAQAGRPAQEPYINTDQGDLLLFVFALAGTIGGFIMGYYWRELFGSPSAIPPTPGEANDSGVPPDFGEQGASKMATEAYIEVRRKEAFCEATQLYEKMGELH